jgi:hypothetical protein
MGLPFDLEASPQLAALSYQLVLRLSHLWGIIEPGEGHLLKTGAADGVSRLAHKQRDGHRRSACSASKCAEFAVLSNALGNPFLFRHRLV